MCIRDRCVDFSEDRSPGELWEDLAVCDEELLEAYLEKGGYLLWSLTSSV